MHAFVVSDLHLGSSHCLHEAFARFLESLPPDASLILNGDSVNHWVRRFPRAHTELLDRLRRVSRQRPLIWVRGNNDRAYRLPDPGEIHFCPDSYAIGKRLYIAHGHAFDRIMHGNWPVTVAFRIVYVLHHCFGARRLHVAAYAKRWRALYRILSDHMARNATAFARAHGYEAVTCGHSHDAGVWNLNGIRYFNTGAWTERPLHCLEITDTDIRLRALDL